MSRDSRTNEIRARFCKQMVEYTLVAATVLKVLGLGKVLTLYVVLYVGSFILFEACVWGVNAWYDRKKRVRLVVGARLMNPDLRAFLIGVFFGCLFMSLILSFWPLAVAGAVGLLFAATYTREGSLMTTNNPIPVPVSNAAGKVETRYDHGQLVVVVRDLAHLRAGVVIAEKIAERETR